MIKKITMLAIAAAFTIMLGAACNSNKSDSGNKSADTGMSSGTDQRPMPPAVMPGVKTVEQYKDEAKKEITKENAEEELEKLKKELEADTGN